MERRYELENLRLAMLAPGSPGLSRDEAMLVLELLMERMTEPPR